MNNDFRAQQYDQAQYTYADAQAALEAKKLARQQYIDNLIQNGSGFSNGRITPENLEFLPEELRAFTEMSPAFPVKNS